MDFSMCYCGRYRFAIRNHRQGLGFVPPAVDLAPRPWRTTPAKWVLLEDCPRTGYSHLDRVFLPVVNKGDRLVGSRDSVNGHTRPALVFDAFAGPSMW